MQNSLFNTTNSQTQDNHALLDDLETHFGSLVSVRNLAVAQKDELFEFMLDGSAFKARYLELFFTQRKLNGREFLEFRAKEFLQFLTLRVLGTSFTAFSNKIGLASDDKFIIKDEKVVLNFPFKDGVIKGAQSKDEDKTNEVFFNDILARDEIDILFSPKALQNFELVTSNLLFDNATIKSALQNTPNLLIKGNNLLALHTLKKRKDIYGQVKLIYIDPPYNTGNDSFNYNDKFNHSAWLTFMKNRLEIAKEFLRDDGVIFVQCDDNEQAYLKVLMDEIFGRENFVNSIIWRYRTYQGQVKDFFPRKHDIILWYKKKDRPKFKLTYRDNYKDTVDYKRWQDFYVDDKIIYPNYPKTDTRFTAYFDKYVVENGEPKNGDIIYQVRGYVVDDVWEDIKAIDAKDKNQKTEFRGGQKPEELIQRILDSVTQEGDLVMDFFAGSGTTLAVAHKMNRRWVGIEQMDYIKTITKERLKKVIDGEQGGISKAVNFVGGGEFVYVELMPLNAVFKEQIQASNDESELERIYKDLQEKAFVDYRVDIKEMLKDKDFEALNLDEKKRILHAILDSNMDYVPLSEIKDSEYGISSELVELNKAFFKGGEDE